MAKKEEFTEKLRVIPELEQLEQRLLLSSAWEGENLLGDAPLYIASEAAADVAYLSWRGKQAMVRPNEWVVRFADSALNTQELSKAASEWGFEGTFENLAIPAFALTTVADDQLESLFNWADATREVLYIEPNFVYHATATIPDDSKFNFLWGLHNTGQVGGTPDADIDAPEAWDLTTGSSDVVVAVIDTGIDYEHADLSANMWTNGGEIPDDGIDNDGNGYIDDVYGWDFAYNDSDPFDGDGHGTHVAGTIGAVGNNGVGIAGVNWNVQLMAIKFLDDDGYGDATDAIASVQYATMMKELYGVNVVASNNSWGGG
ncbi:MAG: S8 family serine peptidase, partial [Planctomycetota bacterium]